MRCPSPERTASGYRKFYDDDVELLKVILTEQRRNYLPLRVIKDRLDSGEIDPTGEHLRPNGAEPDDAPAPDEPPAAASDHQPDSEEQPEPAAVPRSSIRAHPASRRKSDSAESVQGSNHAGAGADAADSPASQLLPGVLLERHELCAMVGMTEGSVN